MKIIITTKAAYLIDYEKHELKLSTVVVHVNLLKHPEIAFGFHRACIHVFLKKFTQSLLEK